jgi:hypothetical protein
MVKACLKGSVQDFNTSLVPVPYVANTCRVDVLPIGNSKSEGELMVTTLDEVFANDPAIAVVVLKDLIVSMIGTGANIGLLKPNSLPTFKFTD